MITYSTQQIETAQKIKCRSNIVENKEKAELRVRT